MKNKFNTHIERYDLHSVNAGVPTKINSFYNLEQATGAMERLEDTDILVSLGATKLAIYRVEKNDQTQEEIYTRII